MCVCLTSHCFARDTLYSSSIGFDNLNLLDNCKFVEPVSHFIPRFASNFPGFVRSLLNDCIALTRSSVFLSLIATTRIDLALYENQFSLKAGRQWPQRKTINKWKSFTNDCAFETKKSRSLKIDSIGNCMSV